MLCLVLVNLLGCGCCHLGWENGGGGEGGIQENITETRLAQRMGGSGPYRGVRPMLPGQRACPVRFEPLARIGLGGSTCGVTTFMEFRPCISSFLRFRGFLELFLVDLVDPGRVSMCRHMLAGHVTPQEGTLIARVVTGDGCGRTQEEVCSGETVGVDGGWVLSRVGCGKQFRLVCGAVGRFGAMARAAGYMGGTFGEVKGEFLSVMGRLGTEAEERGPGGGDRAVKGYRKNWG